MTELKNLNEIGKGLHKKWIFEKRVDYELCCDYLQKINYSIHDFNAEIKNIGKLDIKTITYLILLTTWIQEAYVQIENKINKSLICEFKYKNEDILKRAKKYLRALRSFVVAHPLSTDKHPDFGLDGNYTCVDIATGVSAVQRLTNQPTYLFDMNGVSHVNDLKICDYYLHVYSEKDCAQFFQYFGCMISDLIKTASLYIDKLYALDKHLSMLKRKHKTYDK